MESGLQSFRRIVGVGVGGTLFLYYSTTFPFYKYWPYAHEFKSTLHKNFNYYFCVTPLPNPHFSTTSSMQIRDATIRDIPHLAALFLTAFSEDPDYETAYPWRTSAPDEYVELMTAEITQMFLQGQGRFLLIETEQRQIVAWACWTRKGSSAAAGRIRAENDSVLKGVASLLPQRRMQG